MADYTVPSYGGNAATLLGWLREAVQEGDSWLQAQKPSGEWKDVINRIGASGADPLVGQSSAQYNKTERTARELVASLGSFSHVGEATPVSNRDLYDQAGVLTKLDHNWMEYPEVATAHRMLVQNCVTLGTTYGWQVWDKHFWGPHRGDIRLTALSPDNVTFVQLPADHDIQRAYMVIIREEMPINLAKRVYGATNRQFAEQLRPDRDAPSTLQKGLQKIQQFLSPALRVAGVRPHENQTTSFPTVDIYHAYIMDGAINESPYEQEMGPKGANWAYTVPALGSAIPTPYRNPATGQMFTRPAEPEDCLLFPRRRYCIFSRTSDVVAYDGPSSWWHGQAPLARFRFNDWPWQALGRSCVSMIGTLEASMNAILRGMEDSVAARLEPPVLYDDNLVSKSFAQEFNVRKAGSRAAADLSQGDPLKFPVAPQYYDVPGWIAQHLEYLDGRCDYLTAATDFSAIAKARQLPSGDSLEKLFEMVGPIVQDMVKGLVLPLKQLGQMRLSYYFQFYTTARIITSTDADSAPEDWDGVTPYDLSYTPDQLLGTLADASADKMTMQAKALLREFNYRVSQSGVSEINRMTTKLFYLQLMKLGFPLDWWTYAKVAQLPRFGPEPEGTHTIMERFVAQKRIEIDLAAVQQEEMQQAGVQPPGGGAPGGGGQPNEQQTQPRPGRPPVLTKAPRIVQKDGGTRSTVVTS